LAELNEAGANGDKWSWTQDYPLIYELYSTDDGQEIRVNFMSFTGVDLNLGVSPQVYINTVATLGELRDEEWTDPTDGTGFTESQAPGHDGDNDFLPDGWETEFNLNPKDAGAVFPFADGPFGDPDADGLLNIEEYLGQDGNRSTTLPFINGTGDESNPFAHNTRPDSTYPWRWASTNFPISYETDPRFGLGINRYETLGSALPTLSLGSSSGTDSDDDSVNDADEIVTAVDALTTSPVHSTDPFRPKSAVVTNIAGIVIPDPEPSLSPAGVREDMQRRDWTIECYVKLLAGNMSGEIFNFQTMLGASSKTVYRLALSNNIPSVAAASGADLLQISAKALPTNQWVHLAAVWDHNNNSLAMYVQGVLAQIVFGGGESPATFNYPATNVLAFGSSADGSFVNNLYLDEIRIWGIARSARQISEFSRMLVPQNLGDDVWIDDLTEHGAVQFFNDRNVFDRDIILVNGGSLFAGEPGVVITNVMCSFKNQNPASEGTWGVYTEGEDVWFDNGDQKYIAQNDVLIKNGGTLAMGENGRRLFAVSSTTFRAQTAWNDKDGSGGFTRDSLLAYYRFDDGGTSAEDFARKAKTGLLRAIDENYTFGDHGYALNNGFGWVTNDAGPTLGVDARGSDDSDDDGMPDAWESVMNLDPFDNGAGGETVPGGGDGPYGADGDVDADGLNNLNEFRADTNPRDADSNGDGITDALEDRDGDGVVNATEQSLGSRPDDMDTDDDGLADNEEQGAQTNPAAPTDPPLSRSMAFGGAVGDYLEVPLSVDQRLTSFTLECMVRPTNVAAGAGILIRRSVENLAGGSNVLNYVLGLESDGAGGLRVYGGYTYPTAQFIIRGGTIPLNAFTHVGVSRSTAALTLFVNGQPVKSTNTFSLAPLNTGKGGDVFLRIGEDYGGHMDEVRVWKTALNNGLIGTNFNKAVDTANTNLIHYFRFDDGQANTNIFPFGVFHKARGPQDFKYFVDWEEQWRHAAIIHGNVTFLDVGGILPPPSLRVILEPSDAVANGAKWILDGGTPRDSGDTAISLAEGTHSLSYTPIAGYVDPANELIVLTNGNVTTLTRFYIAEGTLKINIEPTGARTNGAQWRVDGGTFNDSGATVALAPGDHLVTYKPINSWDEPSNETVSVQSGTLTELTRFYEGDLDGDGIPDDWEALYPTCMDPNVNDALGDCDGDGLTNLDEYNFGTDPTDVDTDNDSFSDFTEIVRGSDPLDPNSVPPKLEFNDFDGDGATDISVFWPQGGKWYIRQTSGGTRQVNWGFNLTIPVPGDYDADDVTDIAVHWKSNGVWYVLQSAQNPDYPSQVTWTKGSDIKAVPGDYDGNGKSDYVVYKQSLGNWYIAYNGTNIVSTPTESIHWGWSSANPVTGDYDGDGAADIAVFWPQGGYWYIRKSSDKTLFNNNPVAWGFSSSTPVPADYDNDRRTDIAVYYAGKWYIRKTNSGQMFGGAPISWGWSEARPVPGDYDNDGAADIAVYYQKGGTWYIRQSSDLQMYTGAPIQFGWSAAYPPGAP
ncbi:MAG TPA: LamG-like jellyroll fold domain-containing protein, partial [Kiritimatiellia bacterium]